MSFPTVTHHPTGFRLGKHGRSAYDVASSTSLAVLLHLITVRPLRTIPLPYALLVSVAVWRAQERSRCPIRGPGTCPYLDLRRPPRRDLYLCPSSRSRRRRSPRSGRLRPTAGSLRVPGSPEGRPRSGSAWRSGRFRRSPHGHRTRRGRHPATRSLPVLGRRRRRGTLREGRGFGGKASEVAALVLVELHVVGLVVGGLLVRLLRGPRRVRTPAPGRGRRPERSGRASGRPRAAGAASGPPGPGLEDVEKVLTRWHASTEPLPKAVSHLAPARLLLACGRRPQQPGHSTSLPECEYNLRPHTFC